MLAGPDFGTVSLGGTLVGPIPTVDASGIPKDPAVLPTYRIYGQGQAPMPNGQGSLSKLDTGTVTAASNATPIQVTAAAHGLNTGTRVNVSGVGGNTAANTETTVTRVDANNFTLDGSAGNGAYTSGGQWHTAGLYQFSQAINGGDGYVAGGTYFVLVSWTISGVNFAAMCPFRVV